MAYGLRPVKGLSGGVQTGGSNEYPLVDGETDDIFVGDFLMWEDNGFLARLGGETGISPTTTDDTTITVGVAGGFRWVNAAGEQKYGPYYLGDAGNTNAFVQVFDDPNQLFMVEADGVGATTVQSDCGQNVPAINFATSAANTTSGLSGIQIDSSAAAVTAALGLRLIAIVQDGENETRSGTQTSNVIVKIQSNCHAFGTGVVVAHG